MKRAYILVPGIFSNTGDARNWAPVMASDINIGEEDGKGDEFRYFTNALDHKFKMNDRVQWIIALAVRYYAAGYDLTYVGHSDGCEMGRRVFLAGPAIWGAAHFFAPACDADFQRNGLNGALMDGKVGKLTVHASSADAVLGILARYTAWLPFIAYGTLGCDGPNNVAAEAASRLSVDMRHDLGHGDWFNDANWNATFQAITSPL